MSLRDHWRAGGLAALLVLASTSHAEETAAERQSMEELRNTVINLLQALVQKGLLTREQAEALVKQAQDKASADAAAQVGKNAAQAKEDQNAVRVPYVPQIIKDDIAKQVEQEVKPAVVADVEKDAKQQGWGIPGALPEWLSRVRVLGDITVRYQADMFPRDNNGALLPVPDYQATNAAGGSFAYLDTTEDRNRLRERVRLGVEADVTPHVKAVVRLASGSLTDPGSESQTFGTYGERYTVGFDLAYLAYNSATPGQLSADTLEGGRLSNPWFAPTELVYARDLTFEGVANTVRLGWGEGASDRSHVYMTLGGFPILEIPEFSTQESEHYKWLVGGQLGTRLRFNDGTDHLNVGIAYYDFLNVTGRKNPPDLFPYNYTAPAFVRYGNTMFNILNSTNPTSTAQLFALAAHFRLADVAATFEHSFSRYSVALTAEGVRNIGYNRADVAALTGQQPPANENTGYVGELSFGNPVVDQFGLWRVAVGYRFVRSDAVIDAWTDADFHEGGTNAAGYYVWASYGLTRNTWLRLRYMSGNEIDGPYRYGLDILQLDVSARF
jgi:hypothetical protein